MRSFKINFILDPLKAIRKIAEHFVANFPLDWKAKEITLTIKVREKKISYKKVIYKTEYHFVTKFMHFFCIAAFYISMRFGRDDFGMYFLSLRHSYHLFIGVVRFISLMLFLLLLLLLLLLLMFWFWFLLFYLMFSSSFWCCWTCCSCYFGISVDGAGILVYAAGPLVDVFAAVLSSPH